MIITILGKTIKLQSLIRIFIKISLLILSYYLRSIHSTETMICCIWDKSVFEYHIMNDLCITASDISAWIYIFSLVSQFLRYFGTFSSRHPTIYGLIQDLIGLPISLGSVPIVFSMEIFLTAYEKLNLG